MAENKPKTRARSRAAPTEEPTGAGNVPVTRPSGGVSLGDLPVGGLTESLEADVSDELGRVAPTFGNVLSSIGIGVAESQTALDASVIDTVKELADTKVTVVTDVIQVLDDDGLPDVDETKLVTKEVSVLNFFTPTVHEWKSVSLSMDLEVGEIDNQQGLSFTAKQYSSQLTATGLFWGFVGWFHHSKSESTTRLSSESRQEADWSRGQVRMDASLGPRRSERFPVAAEVAVGPQLFFSTGTVTASTSAGTTTRSVDVTIEVRKADGSVNPNVPIVLDAGGLAPSFATGGGFNGSTTNTDGKVKVTLSRSAPSLFATRTLRTRVTASLGQRSSTTVVVL
jgi:hypothetical protein